MFNKIKQKLNTQQAHQIKSQVKRGQSLVEMAIIIPILIFFLIGVFEVGAALRNYIVLVNVNREITRFAVRPGYMNFKPDEVENSYQQVRDWVDTTLSSQLDLDFTETATPSHHATTLIISHIVVDTGLPCQDITDSDCDDCSAFNDPTYNPFPLDDIIIFPDLALSDEDDVQRRRFGPGSTSTGSRESRLDYETLVAEMAAKNNEFNCEILKKGGVPSANNVIATELFHDQPQLFGFPLISNPFTDPFPLYTHTTMRLISGSRSTGGPGGSITDNIDTIGPICLAFPMTPPQSEIDVATAGISRMDILEGPGGSNWGWLAWNPAENEENYLNNELQFFQMSLNDFTNVDPATGGNDHDLSVGDYIKSLNGTVSSNDTRELLADLVGREIIVPVWDDPDGFVSLPNLFPPPSTVRAYRVSSFVRVRIDSESDIDVPHREIWGTYLGPAENCMPSSN